MNVYFLQAGSNRLKIGKATNVTERIADLQTGSPFRLRLIGQLSCLSEAHAREVEKQLHKAFSKSRSHGEWFRFGTKERLAVQRCLELGPLSVTEAVWVARVELRRPMREKVGFLRLARIRETK